MKQECELCGKGFASTYGLRDHIREEHNGEMAVEEYYYKYIVSKVTGCSMCGRGMKLIWLKN